MILAYEIKGEAGKKEVVVDFDPPLLGYDEVKPRLIAMKAEARDALGMVWLHSLVRVVPTLVPQTGRVPAG
jgi:hypothetical protein